MHLSLIVSKWLYKLVFVHKTYDINHRLSQEVCTLELKLFHHMLFLKSLIKLCAYINLRRLSTYFVSCH